MAEVVNVLTLAQASRILDEALATARAMKMMPMTVAVLDAGGHLIAYKKEDNSGILRFEIAFGKAWGALGMGRPSRMFEQMAQQRAHFVNALAVASGGRLVPVAGGVLIRNSEKRVIGAVGISGDTSDNDEICAIRGIRAAGLVSDPEKEPETKA
ncbi:MAG: GlcG protein [Betaproteobacteria bacterium RBG_16_64_9]|nr:MAG: GlcG protein [Betaproteobacteria bacterium RBG_16_64_9]OGA20899.1 MAG: GlcG protein [Betaproteobacteria bacterium RIFCSPLOWO2_02_FULL_65_24]OGA75932.1 MAG: GlcG protein [Betaproteobacteria bacterium RIFCSPLOWO2_12_FULL_66_14]